MSLPNAPIERIIRKAGAERVSEEAVDQLRFALEDLGEEVAADAVNMASHAGRNTVKEEDVEIATQ
ncbi:histone family protein [Candidatus Nanosalina sp. VS9-1]|uniref:histone family protein n=1 Tax=Candidatus Nanosalina sp. VS9-1 TaxID=3388566 RepID=UPI0039E0DE30